MIDKGEFSACEPVDLELDEEVALRNVNTNRSCTYESGELGILVPGVYIAVTESETYKFEVV